MEEKEVSRADEVILAFARLWSKCFFVAPDERKPLMLHHLPISSQALAAKTAGRDKLSSRSRHRVQFFLRPASSMESGDAAVAIGRFTMVRLSFT